MENLLPEELTIDILARLPAESVLQCRRVCKTWRTLILDASFVNMHLRRHQLLQVDDHKAANKLGLLFLSCLSRLGSSYDYQLHYGEYDENNDDNQNYFCKTLREINHPPIKGRSVEFICSCNGLILYTFSCKYDMPCSICICNPITNEYVNLPDFGNINNENKLVNWMYGFGYSPSTNEYKVVRIYYYNDDLSMGRVYVYTLGGCNGWREKGTIALFSGGTTLGGVHANGALHWMDEEGKVVAFDLADEKFHLLPSCPPCSHLKIGFLEVLLGGRLSVVHQVPNNHIEIWSLKKNSSYNMNEHVEDHCNWHWSKEFSFSIPRKVFGSWLQVIALSKGGGLLLLDEHGILSRYDPETNKLDELLNDDRISQGCIAIPHIHSFVSLNALGERSMSIKEDSVLSGIFKFAKGAIKANVEKVWDFVSNFLLG